MFEVKISWRGFSDR